MKVSLARRRKLTTMKVVASTATASKDVDISRQVAKASAYLNATRAQFVVNVAKAKRRLKGSESGVLAGPLARR